MLNKSSEAMTDEDFLESELAKAKRRVAALPAWRRAVFERARAAEQELGYLRRRTVPVVTPEAVSLQPEVGAPRGALEAEAASE